MDARDRLDSNVCELIRKAVKATGGNEVFVAGRINEYSIVVEGEVFARGNKVSVPVVSSIYLDWDVLIHNHPSGNLVPSEPDLLIASQAAKEGLGFYIVNNEVTEIYSVVEPVPLSTLKAIKAGEIGELLGKKGPLAKKSRDYEERESQIALTKKIAQVFNSGFIGVFEAGTGVGKSYSYLLPAIKWSKLNKRKVVISTGTINLQHQLMEKDIPAAVKITGDRVKAVLVKGRNNYICLRRFNELSLESDLFEENKENLELLKDWVEKTETGERSDLPFFINETLWSRVSSEADACLGSRCSNFEKCFVMKIRKKAAGADILVVNHHLLFSDIEARINGAGYESTAVLPPYHHIIFDEAHSMESAATSFFSNTLNRFSLVKALNVIYRQKGRHIAGTLIPLSSLSESGDKYNEVVALIPKITEAMDFLEEKTGTLLHDSWALRLSSKTEFRWDGVFKAFETLKDALSSFTSLLREMIKEIPEADQEQSCVWETNSALNRIEALILLCGGFLNWKDKPKDVFWTERRKTSGGVFFFSYVQTPLYIGETMFEGVFEKMDSVVCLSATLKTDTSFDFWLSRCGLTLGEPERLVIGEYESPFPYSRNVLLSVPTDAPKPDDYNFQTYIEKAVTQLIQVTKGKTLVLFTSYESLKKCCSYVREQLPGYLVLQQGEDDRTKILNTFKEETDSVLFGTDSFWEGVDVPGESLSQVIIVKLPFPVPNDPIHEARAEYVERKGGNGFFDLSVPLAIVRFKQGFGRLMRRISDRGGVTVLDNRIITKRYGHAFINSIPETKTCFEPLETIKQELRKIVGSQGTQ